MGMMRPIPTIFATIPLASGPILTPLAPELCLRNAQARMKPPRQDPERVVRILRESLCLRHSEGGLALAEQLASEKTKQRVDGNEHEGRANKQEEWHFERRDIEECRSCDQQHGAKKHTYSTQARPLP